jgi:hypothetical protein
MNIGALVPPPNIMINRPVKISNGGNLYKIQVKNTNPDSNVVNKYEVWTTKEAVKKHFGEVDTEEPKEYQLKKFARQLYEKQIRATGGRITHKGILVTSDSITHGDPRLWPSTISHPEVKV